jgi:hypothetical protein
LAKLTRKAELQRKIDEKTDYMDYYVLLFMFTNLLA